MNIPLLAYQPRLHLSHLSKSLLGALTLLATAACSSCSLDTVPEWTLNQSLEAAQTTTLDIVLDRADLSITGGERSELIIDAQASHGDRRDLVVQFDGHVLKIDQKAVRGVRTPRMRIDLQVPGSLSIDLQIRQGSVTLKNLRGRIAIESISADVTGTKIDGGFWVSTPRGNVTLTDSTGEFVILGQAGGVELLDLHGSISATTIMGEVEFRGQPDHDDRVKIETDHAGVLLQLGPETSADMELKSVGGRIVCSLPGLNEIGSDCSAAVGGGSALIDVRTVSGPIRIQSWIFDR